MLIRHQKLDVVRPDIEVVDAAGTASTAASASTAECDTAMFEQWYSDHADDVFGYVARRLGRQSAEDLTAETFARAWLHRDRFEQSRGVPRAWLFGIATNLMRDHRRKEQRQLEAYARNGVDQLVDDDLVAALARADVDAVWPQVARALASLSPDERDVVWLQAVADLSYPDIAEALGIPIGTVRSRLSRGRTRLARVLDRHRDAGLGALR